MANAKDFILNIIGKDNASKVVDGVGDSVDRSSQRWDSFRSKANVALTATGAAVVAFGVTSVKAYAESETSAVALQDAFDKFPALANTNIDAMRDLNSELATKTKFDDDATASGQAVLAQFKLTGSQIEQLTPLLQDYAAKTGKDLVAAAEDLGKAMLGQGRSLKAVGVDFKDAGSVGANFDQVMAGLSAQVGGFAEKEGASAAGQAAILTNQFGEIQETVGGSLMPVLMTFSGWLISAVTWINDNTGAAGALAAVIGTLGVALAVAVNWTTISATAARIAAAAQWLWNAAMSANPIGIVITLIAALVAGIVWLVKNWDAVAAAGKRAWEWIKGAWASAATWFNATIVQPIARFFAGLRDSITSAGSSAWDAVTSVWSAATGFFSGVVSGITGAFSGVASAISAPFKNAFHAIRGAWNSTVGGKGFSIPGWVPGLGGKEFRIPMLATGGSIAQGGWAVVGEKGPELAYLPTGSHVFPNGVDPRRSNPAPAASPVSRNVTVNVTNHYPVSEPGSVGTNRALDHAAAIGVM